MDAHLGGTPTLSVDEVRSVTQTRRKETDIQAEIMRALAHIPGVVAWRTNSRVVRMPGRGGRSRLVRFGFRGAPDIQGWAQVPYPLHGSHEVVPVPLFIEVKRSESERPPPAQDAFLTLARRHGCIVVVASSTQDILDALQARNVEGL